MAVRTYQKDISLNQRGYVSDFGVFCRTSLTAHPLPWQCGPTKRIYLSIRETTSATSEPFAELAPPGQYLL
ncbi:hypothetical protein PIB30_022798, partial [Stylosanthes scabra]|nr:hypothetical protein [Stylosanthes scabra]